VGRGDPLRRTGAGDHRPRRDLLGRRRPPYLLGTTRPQLETFLRELSDGFQELFSIPKPVVAAVNGHAIAGGAILALACDYRIMARGSGTIGVPELRVGVPFPLVPLEIVRDAMGQDRARRAVLLARNVAAEDAVEAGMVDELAEPEALVGHALKVAREMASLPADSYARSKAALRQPILERWVRDRSAYDAESLAAWDSPAIRDAVRAYVEATLG
jgi:enoyl-CoA hydratase